jgi:hypothetical protein
VGVRKVLDAYLAKAKQVKKTSPKAGKGGRSHLETTAI